MNIITREFEGHAVHTFVWNGKPCWIASEIVSLFGYADTSVTIRQCIEAEDFEVGIEYDVLTGKALHQFKAMVHELTKSNLVSQHTRNLTIFYEDGLYGFLQYTEKPVGVRFRKWVRRVVIPSLRQTGEYAIPAPEQTQLEPSKTSPRKSKTPPLGLSTVNNAARIILKAMEGTRINPEEKLRVVKELYARAGVEIPTEQRLGLPVPVNYKQAFVIDEYQELKDATRNLSPDQIQKDIFEVMNSEHSPRSKHLVMRMLEMIRSGTGLKIH